MTDFSETLDKLIMAARAKGMSTEEIREELVQKTTELDGDLIHQHGDMWDALHGQHKKKKDTD